MTFPLSKGDEAILTADGQTVPVVAPLPTVQANPWGITIHPVAPAP